MKYSLWNIIRECRNFIVIVLSVALVAVSLIYGKLIYVIVSDFFHWKESMAITTNIETYEFSHDVAPDLKVTKREEFSSPKILLQHMLREKSEKKTFAFTTLPPWHWVIVDSLWIKAPIIDVPYADHEKLEKGDFYNELESWVVRYPYTAVPGVAEKGNSVIFGHSSVELWDKGSYWFVFQKLPKISIGEDIKVIRDGKLFTYEVDHKVIKRPKDVSKELSTWNDKSYLTLMACYPLLSDAQRILVRGKLVPEKQESLAWWTKNNKS